MNEDPWFEDTNDEDDPCDCESCNPPRDAIEMMKTQLALAVKKGVYLLDEQFPEWKQNINQDTLELSSGYSCVLGQLYGSYDRGLCIVGVEDAWEYGFNYPLNRDDENSAAIWRALNELWLEHLAD